MVGSPGAVGRAPVRDGLSWVSAGRSGWTAWGRCQGSAPEPYQTVAILAGGSDRTRSWCSCPSRQRPCKHVVGLLRRAAAEELPEQVEPSFAREARARLAAPSPRARTTTATADPAAAARRVEQRRERVSAGMAELERWLADQVRGGLAALPRAGYGPVDAVAARMVDAQAPGVAGMLRGLPGEWVGEAWPERALHHLGGLHLLARAHQGIDQLPGDLAATVRSRVGYPQPKAEVLTAPGVADSWWALGMVEVADYQLESRRVWLRGARTGRSAVYLSYAPPGGVLDDSVLPGMVLTGVLHFYPGAGWRALPGEIDGWQPEPLPAPSDDAATVAAARRAYAEALAADPWTSRCPVVINGVPLPPSRERPEWLLRDADGGNCPLTDLDGLQPWPLVAQAAGRPLSVFGEWTARGLRALAVLADDRGREFSQVISG